jgi:NADPH-dependent F420 reductase
MNIAIIGSGKVGKALALASTRAGHHVTLSATDPEHARQAAAATGASASASNREAAQAGDVVILAVPYPAVEGILKELAEALAGKVLIDTTNPLKADGSGLMFTDTSAAEVIQAMVPAAKVVKAFNTVFASRQQQPAGDGTELDGFYAADDDEAKATVNEYVASLGFRPLDAGALSMARTLEAMAYLIISLNMRNGWMWQNGWKLLGPTK